MTIRPIDTSQVATGGAAAPKNLGPATPAGKSFASALTKAEKLEVPQGETWAPVAGHDNAAKITEGPRKGQYINLSHGDRRGQTFTVENRNGKEVHVYGSGSTEVAIASTQDASDSARKIHGKVYDNGVKIPKGEQWAPVAGHDNYADILNGKRNGLFVNISGGVRDGMAFQVVHKSGKTFHVYGSGKHRQEIEVGAHKNASSPTTPTTSPTPATGTAGTPGTTGSSGSTSQTGPGGA
jgi:hypothetical protein